MHVLIIYESIYGERIYNHICAQAPKDWEVFTWKPPLIHEVVVDDPEIYLPEEMPSVDLILHLAESPQAAQLIPEIVEQTGAKGVVVSIDYTEWVPQGLRNQLKRELNKMGVEAVFSEPLCSLDVDHAGFGGANQAYSSKVISQFARHFGRPELQVTVDENGMIDQVEVLRGAPCGSTQYTAGRIKGRAADDIIPSAGLMCLHYPCLASMKLEQKEGGIDTIMHSAGKVFNESLGRALGNDNAGQKPVDELKADDEFRVE